jgi:3-hydroxyacyl-[acyl-carrier-protein] dehydratase
MTLYHHDFQTPAQYLHHRSPYLLVEKIVSIDDRVVVTESAIKGDEFFLTGHFPGAPIFPGAMMQELTTQTAGILIAARFNPMESFDTENPFHNEFALGVLAKVIHAKYIKLARPGDTLTTTARLIENVGPLFEFTADIRVADQVIMRNAFQLVNIPSRELQGGVQSSPVVSATL